MPVAKKKNALELDGVAFSYNRQPILEGITFTVAEGDYLGIIGPNGGGKTTLIKIILGLLKPEVGSVRIFGENPAQFQRRGEIGYVSQRAQQAGMNFPATVEEVVMSGRASRAGAFHAFRSEDKKAAENAMETAGILRYRGHLLEELSGGERQRVFIARALATEPKILILDEPVAGVDIASQERFYDFIEQLNKEMGITILFVSHDIDVIAHEVKTVLCVNRRLVCHGSPRELIKEEFLEKLYGKGVKMIVHGH
ncbi:MAG: metal ABC transporter ATP-binding protein [Patescibacteria group bacterium]